LKGKELISFANLLKETIQERLARINTKRLLRFEILYCMLFFALETPTFLPPLVHFDTDENMWKPTTASKATGKRTRAGNSKYF
jgi:hypothetical protein